MKKILNLKIHWLISIPLLIIIFLYSSYLIGVKATAGMVFAGRIATTIPCSSTPCSCALCGCGPHIERMITPVFGQTPESSLYICTGVSLIPFGTGGLTPGSIILGYSASPMVYANTGGAAPSTNIWSIQ